MNRSSCPSSAAPEFAGGAARVTRACLTPASLRTPSRFTPALLTDRGPVRERNEDAVRWVVGDEQAEGERALLVVADGMGGHQGGEVASRMAVEVLASAFRMGAAQPPARLLDTAFQAANHLVCDAAARNAELEGMGTTLSTVLFQGGRFHVASVGDSRVYLARGGRLRQLSVDDTLVNDRIRRGELPADAAREHPDRNLLIRAIGSHARLEAPVTGAQGVVMAGDCFLLCSDGLHDVVPDDRLLALLQAHAPHEAAERLVEMAKARGATDNITAAVMAVGEGARPGSTADLRRTRPGLTTV